MNEELALKLQAYADGELSGREAREMADLLAQDAGARALLTELINTRSALVSYEADIKLTESREFYWSKIEREIHRSEQPEAPRSLFAAWQRFLAPAGAFAALVILGLFVLHQSGDSHAMASSAEEFALGDSDAFIYQDYANGTTLVWLSYPLGNEFTAVDSEDTLD